LLPPPACHRICEKGITRFHVTCLTCLLRRYLYGKVDRDDYIYIPRSGQFLLANFISVAHLPPHAFLYFIIVNDNGGWLKRLLKRAMTRILQQITAKLTRIDIAFEREPVLAEAYEPMILPKHFRIVLFILDIYWLEGRYTTGNIGVKVAKAIVAKWCCSLAEVITNW